MDKQSSENTKEPNKHLDAVQGAETELSSVDLNAPETASTKPPENETQNKKIRFSTTGQFAALIVLLFFSLRLLTVGTLSEIAETNNTTLLFFISIGIVAYYIFAFNISIVYKLKRKYNVSKKLLHDTIREVFITLLVIRLIGMFFSTTIDDPLTHGGFSEIGEQQLNVIDLWITILVIVGMLLSAKLLKTKYSKNQLQKPSDSNA